MIKTLSKSIREFKKPAILSPVFVALEVILDVLIPLAMSRVIDNGVAKRDTRYIIIAGSIMLVMAGLSLVFGGLSGKMAAHAGTGFAKNLRHDMFSKIQTYSFSNIDKFSSSSLITRMTIDINYVQMSFQMIVRILVRSPFMIVFSLIAALTLSIPLSFVFIGAIPFLGISLFILIRFAMPNFKKMFKKYDEINMVIGENLRGIRTVKSFVREDEEIEKFKKASNDLKRFTLKAERLITWNGPVLQLTVYACIILISLIGAQLVIKNDLTTGNMLSFFTFIYQILMNLNMLTMIFVMFAISKPSAYRIAEVLNEESDITSKAGAVEHLKNGSIVFENVSFAYKNDKMVLKNINLDIKSGQTIGIIGGTGSGKTTLVSLISRLYDVNSGQLIVGGNNVQDYDVEKLRDNVAVVLQKNVLFKGTITENLRWGKKDATMEEIKHVCKLAQAQNFIESFPEQYETMIDQGGTNVSGGQKQRLCIARALLKNPKIIILDDSTSAIDTKTDSLIRKAFKEYIPGVTKIIIAQRISSVEDADQIIVMDKGSIASVGNHDYLLANNHIYREVYESQNKGAKDET